jgi:hypothetical protein
LQPVPVHLQPPPKHAENEHVAFVQSVRQLPPGQSTMQVEPS